MDFEDKEPEITHEQFFGEQFNRFMWHYKKGTFPVLKRFIDLIVRIF